MIGATVREARRLTRSAARILRLRDWWNFKLSPALALFYGVLLSRDAGLLPHLPDALLLVAALAVSAAFVSMLNDLFDIRADALGGKRNGMAGRPAAAKTILVLLPALCGAAAAAAWRQTPLLAACYAGPFVVFILYSVPPFRLKDRGAAGVAADAGGAHLLPALTAALLALRDSGGFDALGLLAAAALWSTALGLRGILWHELNDLEADRRAGAGTLALRRGAAPLIRFGERIVFPIELGAFAALLWTMQAALAALALLPYLLSLVAARDTLPVSVVAPRPPAAFAFQDFYTAWLPAAIILQSAARHPGDILLLGIQAALFPALVLELGVRIKRLLLGGRTLAAR